MSYPCQIEEKPEQPTLSIRTRVPVTGLPDAMGQSIGRIAQYLDSLGEQPAGPPYTAYYNMDMEDLDIEIGVPVAHPLPAQGELQAGQIPGGQQATCLYTGPYDGLAPAYEALETHVKASGGEATGVAYEFYLNDPFQTAPQQIQTRIMFPLK